MIDINSVVSRSKNSISAEIGAEAVIINTDTGQYYALDAIGAAIWAGLEEPRDVGSLCAELCREFDVSMDECLNDVRDFLETLSAESLLTLSDTE